MSPQLKADLAGRRPGERRFLTVSEYCELSGESRTHAYRGMMTGRIPYTDRDGRRRIPASFLDVLDKAAFADAAKRRATA